MRLPLRRRTDRTGWVRRRCGSRPRQGPEARGVDSRLRGNEGHRDHGGEVVRATSRERHPDTQYVAGRIASRNRKEFVKGKWTARLKVEDSGQAGMFPAWWLLGARNNEPPVQEPDETVCWPITGSGEIDIFEHHADGGPDHYAARAIKSQGHCGGGNWREPMRLLSADLDQYHEYSIEQ